MRGVIDGYNESFNNIAINNNKNGDYTMIKIRLRNTEKSFIPHYSYIFHKPGLLGAQLNTIYYISLCVLSYLGIYNGKDETKENVFQNELVTTGMFC